MSAIQLPNNYTEDERWIEAGAEAFALHVAACCYSDRMDKDGLIPKTMVARVALMLDPSHVESAVESLVDAGFWSPAGKNYRINRYLEDKIGLSAEEKIATRNRWADNKRTRRQHNNGNHSACSPRTCKYAEVSTEDSTVDSTTDSAESPMESPSSTTLPDTTRHDPNPVGVRGVEGRGAAVPASASAGAPAPASTSGGPDLGSGPSGWSTPPVVNRQFGGVVVTPEMAGGRDPWTLSAEELAAVLADPAESLDGLVAR